MGTFCNPSTSLDEAVNLNLGQEASRNNSWISEQRSSVRINQETLMLKANYTDGQGTYSDSNSKRWEGKMRNLL